MSNGAERVAVVAGLRTPFARAGTALASLRTVDLAAMVVRELLVRSELPPSEVTLCVYGQVVPTLDWLNIAREVVLRSGLAPTTDAFSVSRACATSIQALTSGVEAIASGAHDFAVVGGADSMSDVPIGVTKRVARALVSARRAKDWRGRLAALKDVRPRDLVPPVPGFSREPTTGELMGEAAEKMAKENGITRAEQDEIAHRSHVRAARAWAEGVYGPEVMQVLPPGEAPVSRDNQVREGSRLDAYAALGPAFDPRHGTVTAGNSSPLSDGASALLLAREAKAKALGLPILGFVRSWAYAAVDPGWQLLMAPVFAAPRALERAGMTLADMDLVDMHEAFAAQVASNLKAMASARFAEAHLGRGRAVGEVDPDRLNVNGGSIALGHPFAATGARMVLSTLHELRRRGAWHALLTVCAAGGLGAAVVLEAE
jgi:acetyl-CoA acyltransferase